MNVQLEQDRALIVGRHYFSEFDVNAKPEDEEPWDIYEMDGLVSGEDPVFHTRTSEQAGKLIAALDNHYEYKAEKGLLKIKQEDDGDE